MAFFSFNSKDHGRFIMNSRSAELLCGMESFTLVELDLFVPVIVELGPREGQGQAGSEPGGAMLTR